MTNTSVALPPTYASSLASLNLQAAWMDLGRLTPRKGPIRQAIAVHWRYTDVREKLLEAGALVPIELAERRVLALINPGLAPRLATTPSIFAGMQLILAGENAPEHRHTPSAARLVVEGSGAFTVVNGERLTMEPGDVILTPTHHWHEHVHPASEPMIWMDLLDHPVAIPLETSYSISDRPRQRVEASPPVADRSEAIYTCPGVVPYRRPTQAPGRYPLLRFRWRAVRAALERMAGSVSRNEPVHMMYVNPETGASLLETLGFSVLMLREGEEVAIPRRSASAIFFVLGGEGESEIDGETFAWQANDTISCPTFAVISHQNRSSAAPAFILQIDDAPLQHKLGFYEDEIVQARFSELEK